MSFRGHWLSQFTRSLFRSDVRSRRVGFRQRPVEALEERKYLSATMTLLNSGHTLNIVGDRSDNHIAITQNNHDVQVTADGGPTQRFTGITSIQVSTGDGNDDVRVIYGFNPQPDPPGDTLRPSFDLRVSLGAGDDTFVGDIMLPPGPCTVGIDGGLGNDNVACIDRNSLGTNYPSGSSAIFYANLGAGNDVFKGDFEFPPDPCQVIVVGGDGNDVVSVHGIVDPNERSIIDPNLRSAVFSVDLGAGNDVFNGDFAFPPDPCRVTVDAGAGDDVVTLNAMLDHNGGGFNFSTTLGLGNDRFNGNVQFPSDPSVPPDPYFPPDPCRVSVTGDGGNDSINALIGLLSNAMPAGDAQLPIELMLNGGDGVDYVMSTFQNVNLNGHVGVDLEGGAGNDVVMQKFDNVTINGGMDLVANGGAGDDYVILSASPELSTMVGIVPKLYVNSAVHMNVLGDTGNDRLIGAIIPCIMPVGSLDLVFSGGAGNDVFNVLLGLEAVTLNPPSEHNPPADLDGPIHLAVIGGEGDDQLNLTVQNLGHSTSSLDIRLDGAPGKDTIVATPGIDTSGWTN